MTRSLSLYICLFLSLLAFGQVNSGGSFGYDYALWFLLAISICINALFLTKIKRKPQTPKRVVNDSITQKEKGQLAKKAEKPVKVKELEKTIDELESRLKDKTLNLASKSKESLDRGRLLEKIKEKVLEIEQTPTLSRVKLAEVRRILESYLATDDQTFEIQMDELHQEFFKNLKDQFPELSVYDLRLCAYLKIGLSSKEIAEILNVLPSSINVSRSRLRKKLQLQPEDELYEFLNQFDS